MSFESFSALFFFFLRDGHVLGVPHDELLQAVLGLLLGLLQVVEVLPEGLRLGLVGLDLPCQLCLQICGSLGNEPLLP